jgi:hypothetical protein
MFLSFFRSAGLITAGTSTGTAQTIAAAKANRTIVMIQNNSDTVMYVRFGGTASSSTGFAIAAGTTWTNPPHWCPTGLVSVIGTNTKTYLYHIN